MPTVTEMLADAQLPMGTIFSNLTVSPLQVYLAADVSGLPGQDLSDLTLASGQSVAAWPAGNLVTYGCTACSMLDEGTQYWLVAGIPNLSTDHFESVAAWNWNSTQDFATGANFAYNDTQFATGWQYGAAGELRPAFAVDGIPTPEPATFCLIGAGLILL